MALLGLIIAGLKRQKRTTFHHNHNKQISVAAYGRNVNSRMTTCCHLELLVREPLRQGFFGPPYRAPLQYYDVLPFAIGSWWEI